MILLQLRKALATLALAGLATTTALPAEAALPIYLNERPLQLPAQPVVVQDRVLVPLRGYMEAVGAQVHWQPSGSITVHMSDRTVSFTLGSTEARVGSRAVQMDVPAQLIGDVTYVPVRFLSEGLGVTVQFDGSAVRLTMPVGQRVVFDGPLNVRQTPSLTAPIMMTVPTGTPFDVLAVGPEWTQVLLPKGRTGWVSTQFTEPLPPRRHLDPIADLLAGPRGYLQVHGRCLGAVPVVDGRLYVPLRPTIAQLGGQVTTSGQQVQVRWRGQDRPLPAANLLPVGDDELLVPARTLADSLGLQRSWDDRSRVGGLDVPGAAYTSNTTCNPDAAVRAYYIMDARSGLPLAEYQADLARPIASTTKIMTALLALEQGDPNSIVTVSPYAARQIGTRMGLRAGDRLPLRDLLYGLMLPSGNDAASTIAEHLSGTEYAFAQAMTRRAAELGAKNTLFYTASGLDDDITPYSTARDLAIIAREAMRNPEFRTIAAAPKYQYTGPRGTQVLTNRNDFVLNYQGATGVKTGWTELADHTIVASAYRNGVELIVVALGATTRDQLYAQANQLMDHGFRLAEASWLLAN